MGDSQRPPKHTESHCGRQGMTEKWEWSESWTTKTYGTRREVDPGHGDSKTRHRNTVASDYKGLHAGPRQEQLEPQRPGFLVKGRGIHSRVLTRERTT